MKKYLLTFSIIVVFAIGFAASIPTNISSDDTEQSSNENGVEEAPSWIQGSWICTTPYGSMRVEIVGDHIREIFNDGATYYGTYHIDGDYIIPETNSHTHYLMEKSSMRIAAGQGYYFKKQ